MCTWSVSYKSYKLELQSQIVIPTKSWQRNRESPDYLPLVLKRDKIFGQIQNRKTLMKKVWRTRKCDGTPVNYSPILMDLDTLAVSNSASLRSLGQD